MESSKESAYRTSLETVLEVFKKDEERAPSPEGVARLIGRILDMRSPAPRYRVGRFLHRLAAGVKGMLPGRVFEAILRSSYHL